MDWVECKEETPTEPGCYEVKLKEKYGGKIIADYWVNPSGMGKSVEKWRRVEGYEYERD